VSKGLQPDTGRAPAVDGRSKEMLLHSTLLWGTEAIVICATTGPSEQGRNGRVF